MENMSTQLKMKAIYKNILYKEIKFANKDNYFNKFTMSVNLIINK